MLLLISFVMGATAIIIAIAIFFTVVVVTIILFLLSFILFQYFASLF